MDFLTLTMARFRRFQNLPSGLKQKERINSTIEFNFSIFFDLIRKNGGDVNETAGDGLMVIFLHPDPIQHVRNAVQTALEIQNRCYEISNSKGSQMFPILVNIGISSGEVYLGSTKMKGTDGDRWTYTASGHVTILAARLADYAGEGQILIGDETARLVGHNFSLINLGELPFKNLENSGKIYQLATDHATST